MFITLTNASPLHKGKTITINSEHIVTIWRGEAVRSADEEGKATATEEVTFVFVPPHGTWEVEELVADVVAMLNPQ